MVPVDSVEGMPLGNRWKILPPRNPGDNERNISEGVAGTAEVQVFTKQRLKFIPSTNQTLPALAYDWDIVDFAAVGSAHRVVSVI